MSIMTMNNWTRRCTGDAWPVFEELLAGSRRAFEIFAALESEVWSRRHESSIVAAVESAMIAERNLEKATADLLVLLSAHAITSRVKYQ